jgi:hypothetical protein
MPSKLDEHGKAERGSQLQLQIYVNRRRDELSAAVIEALPTLGADGPELEWRSPLEEDDFAEYRDEAFLGAIGCADLAADLKDFWPTRGPVWDGLAVAHLASGENGIVLVEAKSHPAEIYGRGSAAGASGTSRAIANREQIVQALASTQAWLGMRDQDPERWMGPVDDERHSLYQTANRLAHLYWLREALGPSGKARKAWLAQVLFVEDPTFRSTSLDEWLDAIPRTWEQLGLDGAPEHVGYVFLQGREAAELGG